MKKINITQIILTVIVVAVGTAVYDFWVKPQLLKKVGYNPIDDRGGKPV